MSPHKAVKGGCTFTAKIHRLSQWLSPEAWHSGSSTGQVSSRVGLEDFTFSLGDWEIAGAEQHIELGMGVETHISVRPGI